MTTKIIEDNKFTTLSSSYVWDNAQGNASCTANKTSVYLNDAEDKCLARMVNISTDRIDEIDDHSLSVDVLLDMIKHQKKTHLTVRMNRVAHEQLMINIYRREGLIERPLENYYTLQITKIAGVSVVIDDDIKNNQETVV